MFTTRNFSISVAGLFLVCGLFASLASTEPKYGFGRGASESEVAAADLDIRFDGEGLPEGKGSADQGAKIYAAQCALCHGAKLEGNKELYIKPLKSDARHSITKRPFAPPLFAYVRRAMPLTAPGSLTDDQVYALVAFLLREAEILPADEATLDAARLRAVEMPNRGNFVPAEASGVTLPKD